MMPTRPTVSSGTIWLGEPPEFLIFSDGLPLYQAALLFLASGILLGLFSLLFANQCYEILRELLHVLHQQMRTIPADSCRGEWNGLWSTLGCRVLNRTKELTICVCNHLTSFAVLMRPGVQVRVCTSHEWRTAIHPYLSRLQWFG